MSRTTKFCSHWTSCHLSIQPDIQVAIDRCLQAKRGRPAVVGIEVSAVGLFTAIVVGAASFVSRLRAPTGSRIAGALCVQEPRLPCRDARQANPRHHGWPADRRNPAQSSAERRQQHWRRAPSSCTLSIQSEERMEDSTHGGDVQPRPLLPQPTAAGSRHCILDQCSFLRTRSRTPIGYPSPIGKRYLGNWQGAWPLRQSVRLYSSKAGR